MIKILGTRGTGKTTQLLKQASETNSIILTSNCRAMREKAKSLGYRNLEIIGFGDLDNDNFSLGKDILVDNADIVLESLLYKFYSIKMIGFTMTTEDENEKRN